MDRRQFLQIASGITAATTLAPPMASAQRPPTIPHPSKAKVEIRAWTAGGQPMPQKVLDQTYFLDLQDEPLPNPSRQVTDGTLWSQLPDRPVAITLNLAVNGFGHVIVYADNDGKGYIAPDFPLNLNLACGRSRIYRVREALTRWQRAGYRASPQVETLLQQADRNLKQAEQATKPVQMAALADESLRDSLWAGEIAVFEQAQQQIDRLGPRPDFLFGCNFFGHPKAGPQYDRYFRELFNFATLPLYWRSFEPQPGHPNFAKIDRSVDWLRQAGITPKGHPLVWFHEAGVPEWVRGQSYGNVRELTRRRVSQITQHFGDCIPYYDIINEAHDIDWSNTLNYSAEQLLEMTQLAAEAAAEGYPPVQRIINTCCAWAQYIPKGRTHPPLLSAHQYLKNCLAAEIPFEIIGLQLYYPNQDMFEINRLLERLSQLGKPIHITELGVSSATDRDEHSYFKDPSGLWHQPWSEAIQADWVEQFYTLCYSKPYIHAITWWDFTDGGFWPHGGLLHADKTPKEAYIRLLDLRHRWREDPFIMKTG